eukprot:SAG31_NODE_4017_length_3662_cov_2.917485_4_plen_169_part_00
MSFASPHKFTYATRHLLTAKLRVSGIANVIAVIVHLCSKLGADSTTVQASATSARCAHRAGRQPSVLRIGPTTHVMPVSAISSRWPPIRRAHGHSGLYAVYGCSCPGSLFLPIEGSRCCWLPDGSETESRTASPPDARLRGWGHRASVRSAGAVPHATYPGTYVRTDS